MSDTQDQHNLFRILQQKISMVHSQKSISKRRRRIKLKLNRYKQFAQHQNLRVMLHQLRVQQIKQEYKRTLQFGNDVRSTVIIQKLEQSPLGCMDEEKNQKDYNNKIKVLEEQLSDCEQFSGPIYYEDIKQMEHVPLKIQDPIIQASDQVNQDLIPHTLNNNLKVLIEETDDNLERMEIPASLDCVLQQKESLQQIKQNEQLQLLEQLQQLEQQEQLEDQDQVEQLEQFDQVVQLKQLEQLEQLEQLDQVELQQQDQFQPQELEIQQISDQNVEIQQLYKYESQSLENIQNLSQFKELDQESQLQKVQYDNNQFQDQHQENQDQDQDYQMESSSQDKFSIVEVKQNEFEDENNQSQNINLQQSSIIPILQEEEESTISKNVYLDILDRSQQELQYNHIEQLISQQFFSKTQKLQLEVSYREQSNQLDSIIQCQNNQLNHGINGVKEQNQQFIESGTKKIKKVKRLPKKRKLLQIYNKIYKKQQNKLTNYFQTLVNRVIQ